MRVSVRRHAHLLLPRIPRLHVADRLRSIAVRTVQRSTRRRRSGPAAIESFGSGSKKKSSGGRHLHQSRIPTTCLSHASPPRASEVSRREHHGPLLGATTHARTRIPRSLRVERQRDVRWCASCGQYALSSLESGVVVDAQNLLSEQVMFDVRIAYDRGAPTRSDAPRRGRQSTARSRRLQHGSGCD